VRLVTIIAAGLLLTGCGAAPDAAVARDETRESWYMQTVAQLTAMSREAEKLFQSGQRDAAADVIQQAQPVMSKALSVRKPSLAAAEACSDLDDLYGRMLYTNRNYAWARFLFQKNFARWKHWTPQTPDTIRRMKEADKQIADCDRHI
jgi:hypothetical protein